MNPLQIAGGILGTALAVAIAGGAWHCWTVTAEYATFKDGVRKAGEEAEAKRIKQEAKDKAAKEKADAENQTTIARLRADVKRLRAGTNTTGGSLSANPAGSKCPDGQTCFDKAEYQRADGAFVAGARSLADEGTEITADLDTAKIWAKGLQ